MRYNRIARTNLSTDDDDDDKSQVVLPIRYFFLHISLLKFIHRFMIINVYKNIYNELSREKKVVAQVS